MPTLQVSTLIEDVVALGMVEAGVDLSDRIGRSTFSARGWYKQRFMWGFKSGVS